MSKNELQTGFNGLLNTIQSQIEDDDITEVSYKINKKKGIMSISEKKNNEAFRATKQIMVIVVRYNRHFVSMRILTAQKGFVL